jgi:hypothetical protein
LHIETVLLFNDAGEMGKEGNWFSAVKRAFHSPSKDKDTEKSEPKDPDLLVDIYRVTAVSSSALHSNIFRKQFCMHVGIPSDMKEIKCDFSLKIRCSTQSF